MVSEKGMNELLGLLGRIDSSRIIEQESHRQIKVGIWYFFMYHIIEFGNEKMTFYFNNESSNSCRITSPTLYISHLS